MTELKAKASRAPHVAGGAPSPTQAGSPRLGRLDAGSLPEGRSSDASPVAPAVPIALDGLLFPRPCQQQNPDGRTEDQEVLSDVEGVYPRVEATGGAVGGSSRPPEKDSGLLDSVLDTLLAPPGSGQSHASLPACEAPSLWCLFGSEVPEEPRAAPATQRVSPSLMSRPEGKTGDSSGAAATYKALPRGLSPSRQLLPSTSGGHHWPGAAVKPSPQPAVVEVEEEDGSESEGAVGPLLKGKPGPLGGTAAEGGAVAPVPGAAEEGVPVVLKEDPRFPAPRVALAEQDATAAPGRSPLATMVMDFIHVPILPLNSAFLAARTRQLLEGEHYDGGAATAVSAFAPPRGSPSTSSTPAAAGEFPDCSYPPDAEPKDDAFPLYGDFQPPALKIKEEEEGAEASARSPRPYLLPGASPAVFPDFQLAPPPPPRVPSCRPGEEAVAAAPPSASVSGASSAGSTLECVLYKAEGAPPPPGPLAPPPPPCKAPGAGSCLLPRDGLPSTSASAAGAAPALYPPLGLNGIPQLSYQAAMLKEGLPQVYPPYLNYLR